MKSVSEFNSKQVKVFNLVVSDFGGSTMTAFVLSVLENVAYQIAQPHLDQSWVDEDTKDDFDVCMAALEYYRMQNLEEVE